MRRAYLTLLRLYPRDYRSRFAAEMLHAFETASQVRRALGIAVWVSFVLAELIGLMFGAGAEWIAKLTTNASVRGRCLPDLRMMRPPGVPREMWFAGASVSASQNSLPHEVIDAEMRIATLIGCMVRAIANRDFPGARSYSYEEREAREHLRRLREQYKIDDAESNGCS